MLGGTAWSAVKRVLKYVYRFGPACGPDILQRVKSQNELVQVRLPRYAAHVFVRTGTSDVPTFEKVFISREYDFPFPNGQPALIIDAGANVGYASLFFTHRFAEARVIAVEPERVNYELLIRNTAPYANITTVRAALWSRSTTLRIANPHDEPWAFRVVEAAAADSEAVQGVTVPELMALAAAETVGILKIDIEGAEQEVFGPSSEMWLSKVHVIVIELHDWLRGGCSATFDRATSQFNFKRFHRGENIILAKDSGR